MSTDQWQLSLRQLYGTADALERGSASADERPVEPRPVVVPDPVTVTAGRSTGRLLLHTAVHTAATVSLVLATFAIVDPLLPHPDRPELSETVSPAMDAAAIPQTGANRP